MTTPRRLSIERLVAAWRAAGRRGKWPPNSPRDDDGLAGVPVEPPRPKGLDGGAAASLEFDE